MIKWNKTVLTMLSITALLFSALPLLPSLTLESANTWDPTLGWDFQCHSHTHPRLRVLSAEDIRWEMEQVNDAFLTHGYPVPAHHAYPYGDNNEEHRSIIAEYRLTGRLVWGFMVTYPVPDWFQMKAAQLKRTTGWNRIARWVDDCIANKALLHIFTHDVSEDCSQYGTTPEKLTQVLDYLLDKQNAGLLTIVTMAEAFDYWSTATEGKAMVVVSFDDAYATDYTTVYPLFQERGLKGTSYIVTSFIGEPNHLTWQMIEEMRTGSQPLPKPDLTLTNQDIVFVPESPDKDDTVTITAMIHNIGNENAFDVNIDFYDGPPSVDTLIGTYTIPTLVFGGTGEASTTWTAVSGDHEIYVVIDVEDAVPEFNENNNEAHKTMFVSGGEMHIADIEMTCSRHGQRYTAHAAVTILDENIVPVKGASVTGSWTGAYNGQVSGTTDANGNVILDSGKVKGGGTFTLTVTDVVKAYWTYNPSMNVETSDTIIC